ncbi:MAG: sulfatase-like hydrolase/transferase [Acidobacteria bacterium]|nr:sulfatase-like hydrolase/transferase [Acidobacteriota bacterium]
MISRRALLASVAAPARKPNFLFLIADDHAGYVLGADGNRKVATPNLDHFAGQGVRFARHYCNQPVCTPSRQSLLTGQMPSAAGVTVLKTSLDPSKPTLAKQFKGAGYRTAVFGKMHLNRPSAPGLYGFDDMMTEGDIQKAWGAEPPKRDLPAGVKRKPRWQPFKDPARIWLNADKLPFPRYYEEMRGTFTANRAIDWLKKHKNDAEPFALWVSFPEPHSPYDFPIDHKDQYDPKTFAVPTIGPEDGGQIPLIFRDLTPADKQGIIASYYTAVSSLDRNVGDVLQALDRLGLAENTCVFYMADHGYCLGQHGRFEKHCGYEPALRVPLLVRYPGRIRQAAVVNDLTEHIDVPATITDLLGLDPLPIQHGQSLRPCLEGKKPAAPRRQIFSQYLENEEVYLAGDRWKLIFCSGRRKRTDGYETDRPTPGRHIELYDKKADPGEFTNVAAKHPEVVASMQQSILARYRSTHPDAAQEPKNLAASEAIEFYVVPRDA